jgi:hypothetical protein
MTQLQPPRSWTQAEKERFQSLPRETQEYLHTREQQKGQTMSGNPVMSALMLARANDRLVALKHEEAPRSWSRSAKLAFLHLPPEIQVYYVAHEKQRDRVVRRAQNDRAVALQKLATAEAMIADLEKLQGDAQPSEQGKPDATSEIQDAAA